MKLFGKSIASLAALLILCIATITGLVYFNKPSKIIPQAPETQPFKARLKPRPSSIAIPIKIPVSNLEQLANTEIPDVIFTSQNETVDENTKADLHVTKNGKVIISAQDNSVHAAIPIRFEAVFIKTQNNTSKSGPKKNKSQQKKTTETETRRSTQGEITVFLTLKLSITQDWRYDTIAEASFKWNKKPYINWGPFKIRISSIIGKSIQKQLNKAANDINESLNKNLDLKAKAEEIWVTLHEASNINQDPPTWLLTELESVHIAEINTQNNNINLNFALVSTLQTILGDKPTQRQITLLPPLSTTLPEHKGFIINLPVFLEYEALSKIARNNLTNEYVEIENDVKLLIEDIEIFGNGDNIVIAADVNADLPQRYFNTRARIYLSGKPVLDKKNQILYFERFEFDINTNSQLLQAAAWLANNNYVIEEIKKNLVFPMADRIASNIKVIEQQLNRPLSEHAKITGNMETLHIEGLHIGKHAMSVNFFAKGNVTLEATLLNP